MTRHRSAVQRLVKGFGKNLAKKLAMGFGKKLAKGLPKGIAKGIVKEFVKGKLCFVERVVNYYLGRARLKALLVVSNLLCKLTVLGHCRRI